MGYGRALGLGVRLLAAVVYDLVPGKETVLFATPVPAGYHFCLRAQASLGPQPRDPGGVTHSAYGKKSQMTPVGFWLVTGTRHVLSATTRLPSPRP
jgi:hypothetical protein